MKLLKPVLAALLAGTALTGANATIVINTAGPVTTYSETFDSGSSFTGGTLLPLFGDRFLLLSSVSPLATFQFSTGAAMASLDLSFWYSALGGSDLPNHGHVTLTGGALNYSADLNNTPGSAVQYGFNNPGPANSGFGAFDVQFMDNIAGLAANTQYTLSFSSAAGHLSTLKFDDLSMNVTAVPEPQTYALLLAGLGVVGWMARRRRPGRD